VSIRTYVAAGALLVGALVATSTALALEPLWKRVNEWDVRIDRTLNGCFMMAVYEKGTVLRVGFNPSERNFYMMVANEEWRSLENGKDYDLELQFDRQAPWTAEATGLQMDDLVTLVVTFDDVEFIDELARKQSLYVRYRGAQIANLTLRGSYAAVQETIRCQEQINSTPRGAPGPTDPFAVGTPKRVSDPFR
jgi:hypothetical protein